MKEIYLKNSKMFLNENFVDRFMRESNNIIQMLRVYIFITSHPFDKDKSNYPFTVNCSQQNLNFFTNSSASCLKTSCTPSPVLALTSVNIILLFSASVSAVIGSTFRSLSKRSFLFPTR